MDRLDRKMICVICIVWLVVFGIVMVLVGK